MDWLKNKFVGHGSSLANSQPFPHARSRSKRREEIEDLNNLSPGEIAKGKEIHRIALKFVRDIEKIFKAAREKQNAVPWPGTDDLLSLLSGGFTDKYVSNINGDIAMKEHEVIGSMVESEARLKLGDMINDALGVEDIHGDLCELLLDPSSFTHPEFVKKCTEAGVPNVLVLCLRIMRVIEFENVARERSQIPVEDIMTIKSIGSKVIIATDRVATLLTALCARGDANVGEQIKPHLSALLNLAVSAYPERAMHIQEASMKVMVSLMSGAVITSAAVSLLYHSKAMVDVVKELNHLSNFNQPVLQNTSRAQHIAKARNGSLRSPIHMSSPKTWARHNGHTGNSLETEHINEEDDSPIELIGQDAEQQGAWLVALMATVCTVTRSFAMAATILSDFESAGGYAVSTYMVIQSSKERWKDMLNQICLLVTSHSPGGQVSNHDVQPAANPRAFCIIRAALVFSTPVLSGSNYNITIVHKSEWSDIGNESIRTELQKFVNNELETESIVTGAICRQSIDFRLARLSLLQGEDKDIVLEEILRKDKFRIELLDSVLHLYTNHPANYLLLEPSYNVLSLFICALPYFESDDLKKLVLKTLEVVCVMFKDVQPHSSLLSATNVLHACISKGLSLLTSELVATEEENKEDVTQMLSNKASLLIDYAERIWLVLEKLLEFDRIKYSKLFRDITLLIRVAEPLLKEAVATASSLIGRDNRLSVIATRVISLLCRLLSWLVLHDPDTCVQLREMNVHHQLYDIIANHHIDATNAALNVLERIAEATPDDSSSDLSFLLEVVQGVAAREQRWRQAATLLGLKGIVTSGGDSTRSAFRRSCGFEAVLATISGLDGVFGETDECDNSVKEECYDVMWAAMATLASSVTSSTGSLCGHQLNRAYLCREIGYSSLGCCLVNSGVTKSKSHASGAANLIFQLITERQAEFIKLELRPGMSRRVSLSAACSKIRNADAVLLLLSLLPVFTEELAFSALNVLIDVIRSGGYGELQALCDSKLVSKIASNLGEAQNMEKTATSIAAIEESSILKREIHRDWSAKTDKTGFSWSETGFIAPKIKTKLLEILVLIASHHIAISDLKPIAQGVVLPVSKSLNDEDWGRLGVLATIAKVGSNNPPFFRLGGCGTPGLVALCHTVKAASYNSRPQVPQRRSSRDDIFKNVSASNELHKALVQVAAKSGTQFIHVPGLGDGNSSAWPGNHGFSFSCWVRFAPPHPDDVADVTNSKNILQKMESWVKEGVEFRGIRGTRSNISNPRSSISASRDRRQTNAEYRQTPGKQKIKPAVSNGLNMIDNSQFQSGGGSGEVDSAGGEAFIFPFTGHSPGRRILWLSTFASSDGRAYISMYIDVQSLVICLRASSAPNSEFRFGPILEFATASSNSWHHIMVTHSRPKSRLISSARERLYVYVNGAPIGMVKLEPVPFDLPSSGGSQSQGGSSLYIGVPHPQAFLDPSMEGTAIPLFHMGPCLLVGDGLDEKAAAAMFEVGPHYRGSYSGEQPLISAFTTIATLSLRRVQALGGMYGFSILSSIGGVSEALRKRGLSGLMPHLNITERSQQRRRLERAKATERFFGFLNSDQIVFEFNAYHAVPKSTGASGEAIKVIDDICMLERGKNRFFIEEFVDIWLVSSIGGRTLLGCMYGAGPSRVATFSLPNVLVDVGGPQLLYPLLKQAPNDYALTQVIHLLCSITLGSPACMRYMHSTGGLLVLAHLLREHRRTLGVPLGASVVRAVFSMAVTKTPDIVQVYDSPSNSLDWERSLAFPQESMPNSTENTEMDSHFLLLTDASALKNLVMNHQVWGLGPASQPALIESVRLLSMLVSPLNNAAHSRFNARLLLELGLLKWALHLMLEVSGASNDSVESSVLVEQHLFPTAAVVAAGLDVRHALLGSCALMLQRVLMQCVLSRSFRSLCGACHSTLADGCLKVLRPPGSSRDPLVGPSEDALENCSLLPKTGSTGTIVLTGQAMVRIYLLRCLLDVFHAGRNGWNEGTFSVGTGGASCVPKGVSSDCIEKVPAYFELSRLLQNCVNAFLGVTFTSILDGAGEEASVALAARLLALLLQASSEYAAAFTKRFDGLKVMKCTLIRYSASLPVMLIPLILATGVPVHTLPSHLEDISVNALLNIFSSPWSLEVPNGGPESVRSHAHVAILERYSTVCTVDVLIPCICRNMSIICKSGVQGGEGDEFRASTVNKIIISLLLQAYGRPKGGSPGPHNKFRKVFRASEAVDALSKCLGEALHWEAHAGFRSSGEGKIFEQCKSTRCMIAELFEEVAVDAALCGDPAGDLTGGIVPQSGQASSESFTLSYKIFTVLAMHVAPSCGDTESISPPSFGYIVGGVLNRIKCRCSDVCVVGDARSLAGLGGTASAITEAVVDDLLMGSELAVCALSVLLDLLQHVSSIEAQQRIEQWLGFEAHGSLLCEIACSCSIVAVISLRRSAALIAAEIFAGADRFPAPKNDIIFLLTLLNNTPLLDLLMDDTLYKEARDFAMANSPSARPALFTPRSQQQVGPRKQSLSMVLSKFNREIEHHKESHRRSLSPTADVQSRKQLSRKDSLESRTNEVNKEESGLAYALGVGRRRSSNFNFDIQGFIAIPQDDVDTELHSSSSQHQQQPWLINKISWVDKLLGITDIVITTGVLADIPTMLMSSEEEIRVLASSLLSRVLFHRPSLVCDVVSKHIFVQLETLLKKKDSANFSDLFSWLDSAANDEKLRLAFRSIAEKSTVLIPTVENRGGQEGTEEGMGNRKSSGSVAFWGDDKKDAASAARTASQGSLQLTSCQSWKLWSSQKAYSNLPGASDREHLIITTYNRVAESHKRWVWHGVEDVSFASMYWSTEESRELSLSSNCKNSSSVCLCSSASSKDIGSTLHWKLDLTEGPSRTRTRLVPNHDFFDEYNVVVRTQTYTGNKRILAVTVNEAKPINNMESDSGHSYSTESLGITELEEFLKDMTKITALHKKNSFYEGAEEGSPKGSNPSSRWKSMFEEDFDDDNLDLLEGTELMVNTSGKARSRTQSKHTVERKETIDSEEVLSDNPPIRGVGTADTEEDMAQYSFNANISPDCSPRNPLRSTAATPDDPMVKGSSSTEQISENYDEIGMEASIDMQYSTAVKFPPSSYDESLLDYEVVLGLIDSDDWPVEAVYNVTRCIGLETRRAALVLTQNTVIVIEGFEIPGEIGGHIASKDPPPIAGMRVDRAQLLKDLRHVPNLSSAKMRVRIHHTGSSFNGEDIYISDNDTELPLKCEERPVLSRQSTLRTDATESIEKDDVTLRPLLDGINVFRLSTDELHAVYKRRYELRDVALELFDVCGRSVLIAFQQPMYQEEALSIILARELPRSIFNNSRHRMKLPVTGGASGGRSAYKRFMQAQRLSCTRRWQEGAISNFDYLMELNTLAGRTFNDITQYPVFPWVISDYTSSTLDLTDPRVYRDLTKPMGALGEERASQFRERYESVLESAYDGGDYPEPPPFHYGTHYSCAGYVLYYLLRLEPYTRMALTLQGGQFDKADRLFRDIRSSWESASAENLQDVRELIPEFYCLPEFLMNLNGFDLGVTQRGSPVHHVNLPPWANNDPREFIRIQRCALESPIVSANLHSWVDLIFGCKQRGPEAVKAQNVFVHLTYEGEVDIDAIDDPMLREATLAQIKNFGQTPTRLFKRPHDQRVIPSVIRVDDRGLCSVDNNAYNWHMSSAPPLCIIGCPNIAALKNLPLSGNTLNSSGAWSGGYIGDLRLNKDKVILTGSSCILYPGSGGDEYMRFGGTNCGVSFHQFGLGSQSGINGQPDFLLSSHDDMHSEPISYAAFTESGSFLSTGSLDGSVRVWRIMPNFYAGSGKSLQLLSTLTAHSGPISCIDISERIQTIVTGSVGDARVFVWDLSTLSFLRELSGHLVKVDAVSINRVTGGVVTLAHAELRVWGINGDMLAQCSAAALRRSLPTIATSTQCGYWQDGIVAVTGHDNGDVSLWGINWGTGKNKGDNVYTQSETPPKDLVCRRVLNGVHNRSITCIRVCEDQREVLVGDAKGVVSRWQCLKLGDLSQSELSDLTST